jgi:uncharacterized membrane protein HdeD (DUF308 family)
MDRVADRWWILVVRAVASFAFAGLLLVAPGWSSLGPLAIGFGLWAAADGGISLALVVGARRTMRIAAYVGRGCLGVSLGALALRFGSTSALALYALVAAWAIGAGALEMGFASRAWFVLPLAVGFMIVGGISLFFGMVLVPFPLQTAATLRGSLVAFAVVSGVAALIVGEKLHTAPLHRFPRGAS